MEPVAAQLEGRWTTTFNPGYVVMGSMVMPHPAAPSPETGRMERTGGELTIVPDSPDGIALPLEWETEVNWSFDRAPRLPDGASGANVPELAVDDEDLSVIAGCSVNELPRLVGTGSATMDGVTLAFTTRMIVVNPDLIFGFQQVDGVVRGQSMVERRSFVMSR
ncbi:hypothetical protein [Histidinibacterium aquaticum]|nr:hypothetical protein [Histidinibacterium aquaticum]